MVWLDIDLLLSFVKHADGHDYSTRRHQEKPRLTIDSLAKGFTEWFS
jgi:hypothetical protein